MKRILVIKMWALGDILVATPLLSALKAKYPDCSIDWLVDKEYAGVLEGNLLLDNVVSIDWKAWQRDFRYGNLLKYIWRGLSIRSDLRSRNFDILIALTPDKWWCLWFNVAPLRIALFPSDKPGILSKFYTNVILRQPGSTDHHVDRNLLPMKELESFSPHDRRIMFTVTDGNKAAVEQFLATRPSFNAGDPYVVLHPGTSQRTKCWPAPYYAAVADLIGPQVQVIITGGDADRLIAEEIKGLAKTPDSITIAAGALPTIGQTGALVNGASAIVTGDTSMLHIASSLDIPTVAVYGSTRPNDYAPLFGRNVLLFDDSVACSPCYKSSCALTGKDYLLCLTQITPEIVYSKLESLING